MNKYKSEFVVLMLINLDGLVFSILGGILLVLSLYTVLWAKSKEQMSHRNSLTIQAYKECAEVKTEAVGSKPPQPA